MSSGCKHIKELREYLASKGMQVWSEHGEEPAGWVNIWCPECDTTFETTLKPADRRADLAGAG